MKNSIKKSIIISGILCITACSTLKYQEPRTGPLARVRFATDSNQISILRTYEDKSCSINETEWLRIRNGYVINSTPKKLGMALWSYHDNAAKEILVDANREIYGLFQGSEVEGNAIYTCGTPFSYSFQENLDYEVFFKWSNKECRVTIAKIIDSPIGFQKQRLAEFSNKINDENKGCLESFEKPRLY